MAKTKLITLTLLTMFASITSDSELFSVVDAKLNDIDTGESLPFANAA